jgi:YVTN family beta-propeller protein
MIAAAVMFSVATIGAQPSAPAIAKSNKVGAGVYEVVVSPSTGTVYVATAGGRGADAPKSAVFALNGDTLEITKTFDVATAPAYGIGLNDKTQTVYTSNTRNGSVWAIDVKTGTTTEIKTPADPKGHLREVIVDEGNNVVYVSSYGEQGKIWVIDGKTNTVTKVIENVGNGTSGMALDAAGKRLFTASMGAQEIVVLDTTTHAVTAKFPSGGGERPTNIAYDAKTKHIYVANQAGTVSVLDPAAGGKLLSTIQTGAGALDVEVNPVDGLVYASNRGAATVSVIDPKTYAVIATLPTGTANTLTVNTKNGSVYVTNKARPGARGRRGEGQPATPPPPPPPDPSADTVTLIKR